MSEEASGSSGSKMGSVLIGKFRSVFSERWSGAPIQPGHQAKREVWGVFTGKTRQRGDTQGVSLCRPYQPFAFVRNRGEQCLNISWSLPFWAAEQSCCLWTVEVLHLQSLRPTPWELSVEWTRTTVLRPPLGTLTLTLGTPENMAVWGCMAQCSCHICCHKLLHQGKKSHLPIPALWVLSTAPGPQHGLDERSIKPNTRDHLTSANR